MVGAALQIGVKDLPMGLLFLTPIAVALSGAGAVLTFFWLLFLVLLHFQLGKRRSKIYVLETLATSPYAEVRPICEAPNVVT
jgi:hypothetical protein